MRLVAFVAVIIFTVNSYGRSLASIRKDAFTVGVNKNDSAAEYDFISEITAKMKFSRFRLVTFENANMGQKLLLDGKIDAIIARVSYSPRLENKFLMSVPYGKTEIAVATLAQNNEILTLANLNEKTLAFIPADISNEQIKNIWQNSKTIAAKNIGDALNFLRTNQAEAVVADRQTLETLNDSALRIFPNQLTENNTVALFAPASKNLMEEFNNAVKKIQILGDSGLEKAEQKAPDIKRIMFLLNELKKEIEKAGTP